MQQIYSKPHPGTQINFAHPLARGLVGCWLMNEGGQQIYDLSPYKNHGKLYGFDSPPKRSSVGLQFDGINDYVDAGGVRGLNRPNAITVSAYLKLNASGTVQVIVRKMRGTWSGFGGFALQTDSNNYLQFVFVRNDDKTQVATVSSAQTLLTGVWYHVVGVFEDNTDRFEVYVNSVGTINTTTYTIAEDTINLVIGRVSNANSLFLNGTISLVQIWRDRAMNPNEVRQLNTNPYEMFMK